MTGLLAAIVSGYLLLVIIVYFYQPHMLFLPDLPSRVLGQTPDSVNLDYTDVYLMTEDGVRLHGWWVEHPQPAGTLLFFHGNAGNISHRLQTLRLFYELGYRTLIIDYRGYGQSDGTPSESGLYTDADAAWQYLVTERGLAPEDIVISGRSLGAAVALQLSLEHPPRALIMESAFTSVPEMAAVHYSWLPVRWLSRFKFNNLEGISRLSCPILLVHGLQDEIVPYQQSLSLYARAPSPKQLLTLQGRHNDAQLNDYLKYREGLQRFLASQ